MSDQQTGRAPHRWAKGESGNRRGRPRSGLAFAERIRERVDPDLVIDLALRVAADESLSASERLAALLPLIDRGFIRPPTTAAVAIETTGPQLDWSRVPLATRVAMLEAIRAARALPAGAGEAPAADLEDRP